MNILGNKVLLRAIEIEDLNIMQIWANNQNIQYMIGGWHFPTNKNDHEKWFNNLSCTSNNQRFMVLDNQENKIGMANLLNINFKDGNAELGLIIDSNFHRNGFGEDVVKTLMKYSFDELRLNRLETSIIAYNKPSIELFENKCKWTLEGIKKESYFRKGLFFDKFFYAILFSEFKELKKMFYD